jgi:hypothetical protein
LAGIRYSQGINNEYVSRNHAGVSFENGEWWIRDLNSSNGIYINAKRTQFAVITQPTTIRLGIEGPYVALDVLSFSDLKDCVKFSCGLFDRDRLVNELIEFRVELFDRSQQRRR